MEKINIAMIADRKYLTFLKVTVLSMLINTNSKIHLYCLLPNEASKNLLDFFKDLVRQYPNFSFTLISLADRKLDYNAKNHVSAAAFFKVEIASILNDISQVLYLDSDILIRTDIAKLWNELDNKYLIQAVWNPGYNYDNHVFHKGLDHKTFNSGVMLLNLDKIRKENYEVKLKEFLLNKNDQTVLNDQAAFNAIFSDWGRLEEVWNVQNCFFHKKNKEINLGKGILNKIRKEPLLIHFTSNSKPWQFRNAHPYKKEYLRLLSIVDPHFSYEDKNIISFVRKVREYSRMTK